MYALSVLRAAGSGAPWFAVGAGLLLLHWSIYYGVVDRSDIQVENWVTSYSKLGVWLVFFVSIVESTVALTYFVPGFLLCILCAVVFRDEAARTLGAMWLGYSMGSVFSYVIGSRLSLVTRNSLEKFPLYFKLKRLVDRYGSPIHFLVTSYPAAFSAYAAYAGLERFPAVPFLLINSLYLSIWGVVLFLCLDLIPPQNLALDEDVNFFVLAVFFIVIGLLSSILKFFYGRR
jgi:membrane protein DedA with SNARE-associated domain